jgi:hypothetical protein
MNKQRKAKPTKRVSAQRDAEETLFAAGFKMGYRTAKYDMRRVLAATSQNRKLDAIRKFILPLRWP